MDVAYGQSTRTEREKGDACKNRLSFMQLSATILIGMIPGVSLIFIVGCSKTNTPDAAQKAAFIANQQLDRPPVFVLTLGPMDSLDASHRLFAGAGPWTDSERRHLIICGDTIVRYAKDDRKSTWVPVEFH